MAAKAKREKTVASIVKQDEWTPRRWSKEVISAIPWNEYQIKVFEELQESDENLVVSSTAGSGKSTLLKGIVGLLPPNVKINVMMFNKSVKLAFEQDPRIPKRVNVSTAHGCGEALLIRKFKGEMPEVDKHKADKLAQWGLNRLKEVIADKSRRYPIAPPRLPEDSERAELLLERWQESLKSLLDFARLNLADDNVDSMDWVVNYFAIRFPFGKPGTAWGVKIAMDLLEDCYRMGAYDHVIDYADMVWLPHKLKLYPQAPKAEKSYLLIDECVTGDTLVSLADGRTKRIDEIVRDKLSLDILSFNTSSQQIEVKKITGWYKVQRHNRAIVNVCGLQATDNHPVYTKEQGYIYAGQLKPQHSLLQIDGQKLQSFRQTNDDRAFDYHWVASWRCFVRNQQVERQNGECPDILQTWSSTTRLSSVEARQSESLGWEQRSVTINANRVWWSGSEFCDNFSPTIHRDISPVQTNGSEKTNHRSGSESTKSVGFGSMVYGRREFQRSSKDFNLCFFDERNCIGSRIPNFFGLQFSSNTNEQRRNTDIFSAWTRCVFSTNQTIYPSISFLQTKFGVHSGKTKDQTVCNSNHQTLQPLWNGTRNVSLYENPSLLPLLLQQQLPEGGEKSFSDKSPKNIFMSGLQQRLSESSRYQNWGSLVQDVQQGMWSYTKNPTATRTFTKASLPNLRYSLPISQQLQERSWSLSTNLQQQMWRNIDSTKNQTEEEWVYCIDVEDNHNFFGNGILSHNCQDANRAFISLYKKYELVGYRCIFVGDEKQSISGYMAALPTAMETIIKLFNAKVLPLSESQRCPKSHVALASLISPQMKARQDAIDGTCELMHPDTVKSSVQPGDLVLCRFVAPLIKLFLEAKFFNGVEGVVRARDIAKEMGGFAKQIGKNCKWGDFHSKLLEQKEYLVERYKLAGQLTQADATEDRYRCLEYCYEFLGQSAESVKEFVEKIEEVFPVEEEDRTRHVIYSSIHSAKGDESQRVYVVGINLLPYYRMGMLNWQFQQEIYATFVALTRSKAAMYFVPLERDPVELEKLMQLPCAGLKLEYFEGYEGET